jgi:hypothetical protein
MRDPDLNPNIGGCPPPVPSWDELAVQIDKNQREIVKLFAWRK